ncbi:hypothetical protein VNO77_25300 [Canavalia gladiata]|uniref:Uncharacterized protein n=1 Tax=Canavalia gladiata TaxID=3824 RepID=A0AAN9LAC8_CANGL
MGILIAVRGGDHSAGGRANEGVTRGGRARWMVSETENDAVVERGDERDWNEGSHFFCRVRSSIKDKNFPNDKTET